VIVVFFISKTLDVDLSPLCRKMVDLAKEAFSTNNFSLAADIYDRAIKEHGPTSDLFLGLADCFARDGLFAKAFNAYTNAYRYGIVTPEKLKHLVVGLIDTVKQDLSNSGHQESKQSWMFTCGVCLGLLSDPVTLPCGHTFCRKCLEKDKSKTCEVCNTTHYRLKLRNLNSNVIVINLIQKLFPNKCTAAILKKEGNELITKRSFQRAIEVYNKAIELEKTDHVLLSNRCHAFVELDRFTEALEDAEKCVELRPDWPKGYFRKGRALYGLGKYEDAAVAFLQCLALDQKISSAKDYLSKALDKILSVLPPDDPKAHTLARQSNPTLLQQLIDQNFCKPLLLPDINRTLTDLAQIVKDTIYTASQFAQEQVPEVPMPLNADDSDGEEEELGVVAGAAASVFTRNYRCNSLPDCSSVDHEEIEKITRPRTYSPVSRKRSILPTVIPEPISPSNSSPQKILKSTSAEKASLQVKGHTHSLPSSKPETLSVDDLECGLCYRLFFEPVTTPCGHTFCRKCLDRCLDHTSTCPMCKGNLSEYLAERRQAVTESIQCIIETYFKDDFKDRSKVNDDEMVELANLGSDQADIPVFVCALSFPLLACPLHIFEPRYRLMIRQCMESGTRQFGMCMASADDDEDFSDYGCMMEIRDVQYFPDGRSVVDTVGGRRFRVVSRCKRDGYNTAKVEFLADAPIAPEDMEDVQALQKEVYVMLQTWMSKLPLPVKARVLQQNGDLPAMDASPVSGPSGPAWAWWACSVLPLDPRIQLTLVSMCAYKKRLMALKKVLVYMNRQGSQ